MILPNPTLPVPTSASIRAAVALATDVAARALRVGEMPLENDSSAVRIRAGSIRAAIRMIDGALALPIVQSDGAHLEALRGRLDAAQQILQKAVSSR